MQEIKIEAHDGFILYALMSCVENAKGIVQIVHGMCEHKERYIPFIELLNDNGYSAIIIDQRGHGKSISLHYPYGHIDTPEVMVNDQYTVTKYIKGLYPNKKLYMFAHSMGSMIGCIYLQKHDNEIESLISSGTVKYNSMSWLACGIARLKSIGKRRYRSSNLLYAFSNDMSFDDDLSWLSSNEENVSDYINDPLCGFRFTNYGYLNLFRLNRELHKFNKFGVKNPKLRILLISGSDDRTTGGTKGLKKRIKAFNRIGYRNTCMLEFEGMKHEILFERDNKAIYLNIFEFLREL